MKKTIKDLINDLAVKGGAIVCTNECSGIEIANAMNTDRMVVDKEGLGFVRRSSGWLALQKARENTQR